METEEKKTVKLTQKKSETPKPKMRFTATLSGEALLEQVGNGELKTAEEVANLIQEYADNEWNGNLSIAFWDVLSRFVADVEIDIDVLEAQ